MSRCGASPLRAVSLCPTGTSLIGASHDHLGGPRGRRPARPLGRRADNPWFVRARASGTGRIRAGGIERDVTFIDAPADAHSAIDAAYHAKYDQYEPQIVGSVVGDHARDVTTPRPVTPIRAWGTAPQPTVRELAAKWETA